MIIMLGIILIVIGSVFGLIVLWIGVGLMLLVVLFLIVMLLVEFDVSLRVMK